LREKRGFTALPVGDTNFNSVSNLRFHRYEDNLEVMDMTFAGKVGKRVPYFHLMYGQHRDPAMVAIIAGIASQVMSANNYVGALATAKEMVRDMRYADPSNGGSANGPTNGPANGPFNRSPSPRNAPLLSIQEGERRGVDVVPVGMKIMLNTAEFEMTSTPKDFVVRSKKDSFNLPTSIPASRAGLTQAKKFFFWLKEEGNLASLERMTYSQVQDAIRKATGSFPHSYSAMD